LTYIPSHKISLGMADYSTHWFTGSTKINDIEKVSVATRALDYHQTMQLAKQHNIIWDKPSSIYYVIFSNHWLNEYLFIEDAKSFSKKNDLVKKYKLRGISVFDLGTEDPAIWDYLAN